MTGVQQVFAPTSALFGMLQGFIAKRECLVQLIEVAALLPPSAALQLIRAVRTLTADPPLLLPLYVSCHYNFLLVPSHLASGPSAAGVAHFSTVCLPLRGACFNAECRKAYDWGGGT